MDIAVLKEIEATIEKHKLLSEGDSVLVALSGGADSVFLLNTLILLKDRYKLKIFAAHVNHGLRGKEADEDEKFCRKYCTEKGIDLFVKNADVAKYAAEKKVSEEVAGREIRYAFFEEICEKLLINKIATAHNADDNVETVMMRFIRGSGVTGLCGIPYKNNNIIRPVLDISREEIEEFLKVNKISFVTDKTNFKEVYTRNKLRLSLIPQIEKDINKGFKKSLLSNVSVYNDCSDFLKKCEENAYESCVIKRTFYTEADVIKLKTNHDYIIKSVLKRIVSDFSCEISAASVNDCFAVLLGEKSKVSVSGGLTVMLAYNKLFFYKNNAISKAFCYKITDDNVFIPETGAFLKFTKTDKIEKKSGKNVFFADASKLGNLFVRTRKDGDVFYPLGKDKGKVKLKDFFINSKIPSFLRNTFPVLVSDNEIIWLAGLRHDKRFAANEHTKDIMKIEITDGGF